MNILITDDELLARSRLRSILEELGHAIAGEATTGEQALEMSEHLQPDIVLLDIRMPGMGGIETARHLMELDKPPAVIFTTAYDEHALQAFETHAVDYLLKPIRKERLVASLSKAGKLNRVQLARISEQDNEARTHICARSHNRVSLIPVSSIVYFMADQKYITVVTRDNEILIEESLKSLENEFADHFARVHRNALVARDAIVSMQKSADGGHYLVLKDSDKVLDVSRRHVPAVRKLIRNMG
jgi:two-component system response regulator AlgR